VVGPNGAVALVDTRTFRVRPPAPAPVPAPVPAPAVAPAVARHAAASADGGPPWALAAFALAALAALAAVLRRVARRRPAPVAHRH
jgi:hypothetical protein